jgi:hypothetical protein
VDEFTSAVVNDKEYLQNPKPDTLNREEITCSDLLGVLIQELSPTG